MKKNESQVKPKREKSNTKEFIDYINQCETEYETFICKDGTKGRIRVHNNISNEARKNVTKRYYELITSVPVEKKNKQDKP